MDDEDAGSVFELNDYQSAPNDAGIAPFSCRKFARDLTIICNLLGNLPYLPSPKKSLVIYIILYLPWSFIRNPTKNWQQSAEKNTICIYETASDSNPEGVSEPKKHMLYEHFASGPRFGAMRISYKKDQRLSMRLSLRQLGGICSVDMERQGTLLKHLSLAKSCQTGAS